jgi:hypothetical protein
MQEREELRALKREKKMSREEKIKRKICVWKIKKEKNKNRKVKKYVYERMKEKEEKEKRGVARKI